MNIRGVPVNKLERSQIVPVLPELMRLWKGDDDVKSRIDVMGAPGILLQISLVWLVGIICLSALVDRVPPLSLIVGPAFSLVFLCASVVTHWCILPPLRRFTEDVNRLDDLLVMHGLTRGILDLPPMHPEVLNTCKSLIQSAITKVRLMETDRSSSPDEVEAVRGQYRELASLLRVKFGLDVGNFAPLFLEADRILAEERSKRDKEKVAAAFRGAC